MFWGAADFGLGPVGDPEVFEPHLFLASLGADGTPYSVKTWDLGPLVGAAATRPVIDAAGGIYVAGELEAASGGIDVDLGTGVVSTVASRTAFVVRLEPSGIPTFATLFGPGDSGATGLGVDATGQVVVAGTIEGSVDFGESTVGSVGGAFVARLLADGTVVSARAFDGPTSVMLAVDGRNNAVVAGGFEGSADLGDTPLDSAGGTDAYLADVGP